MKIKVVQGGSSKPASKPAHCPWMVDTPPQG